MTDPADGTDVSASDCAAPHGTTGHAEILDVRSVPKPHRHPLIFTRFDGLSVGESFVLVNSHDPKHLRQEFERDHAGAYEWTHLPTNDRQLWQIKITRRTVTDVPRAVADTRVLIGAVEPDAAGALWRLEPASRQLDANVIRLGPDDQIEAHHGPDLDVILHVLAGSGQIITVTDRIAVRAGTIMWLPRKSQRAIVAGPDGLTYFSVHTRRPGLTITPPSTAGHEH